MSDFKKRLNYFFILYLALGTSLSPLFSIEYEFIGNETLPKYYGNPFVFKQKSLASSMHYFYSVSGILLNTIVWTSILILLRFLILKLIDQTRSGKIFFKTLVGTLVLYSSLSITISILEKGMFWGKDFNYWYFNIDEEAEKWGGEYKGKFKFVSTDAL